STRPRRCTAAICRSLASPGQDRPVASASSSSGKSRKTGTPTRKGRTGFQSLCGRWRKYIFSKTRARDAHVRRRVRVDRGECQQKWKRPFQKRVALQYLERNTICKA